MPSASPAPLPEPLRTILDLTRWAPSGDNTQPWRFELVNATALRVHGFGMDRPNVYDLDGSPNRLALGALLETLRIAASASGMRAQVARDRSAPETAPAFDVALTPDPALAAHALAPFIQTRSVQRRALSTRALSAAEKQALQDAVGAEFKLHWFDSAPLRRAFARLLFRSAHIRLSIEEAYRVHAAVIEWGARESLDRMPDAAIGVDPLTLWIMRWAMRSWERTRFVSRYLGGSVLPRVQLDLLPALRCAGHVIITAQAEPGASKDEQMDADYAAGAALQRFWLTAESLQLRHQPEMTPLIFSRYAAQERRFTRDEAALRTAAQVRETFAQLVGKDVLQRAVWLGRIGAGERARARSLRLPLQALMM